MLLFIEMITSENFSTFTFKHHLHGDSIKRILAAAIHAVEPGEAVKRRSELSKDILRIGNIEVDLTKINRIYLIGFGKAAIPMTDAMNKILGKHVSAALIVTKSLPADYSVKLPVLISGHPIPDERSIAAGEKILGILKGIREDDLVISLISGGGSSLVCCPPEGITLGDLQFLTNQLLACGARINEINVLRRQLDLIKGGGLVNAAYPARVIGLILSDVIGDPMETIASGPTVEDSSSRKDALAILEKYELFDKVPASILDYLRNNIYEEKNSGSGFDKVHNLIIANNSMAARAALAQARREGFNPYLLQTDLQGEAREVAHELCSTLRWAWQRNDPVARPACLIAGGETTVSLQGEGRGGRNMELALSAVTDLADFPDVMLVTLATDGEDGVTDAAGAVVTGETFARAVRLGLDSGVFLNKNDSYSFFSALDDLLKIGPTGTNVNDLTFLFTF